MTDVRDSTAGNARMLRAGLVILSAVASADVASQAPAYPAKPIRLVVPFAPGASNDILSRATALVMGPMLGQLFVIDNRPGAGAMIGAEHVARRLHHTNDTNIIYDERRGAREDVVRCVQ